MGTIECGRLLWHKRLLQGRLQYSRSAAVGANAANGVRSQCRGHLWANMGPSFGQRLYLSYELLCGVMVLHSCFSLWAVFNRTWCLVLSCLVLSGRFSVFIYHLV